MNRVGIIGGGITGLCSAWYLQEAGYQVTILDRNTFTDGCSYGNAGMIVPSHFMPMAGPGLLWKGFKWLTDRRSPLAIKPALDKTFLSWLYHFYRAGNKKKIEQAIPQLLAFSRWSKSLYEALAAHPDLGFEFASRGILMQYLNEKTGTAEKRLAQKARTLGMEVQILNQKDLTEFDPEVHYNSKGAFYYAEDALIEPASFLNGLKQALIGKGVLMLPNTEVIGFKKEGKTVKAIISNSGEYSFDQYVICGGAWSSHLAAQMNIFMPILGGKGYSFMIPNTIRLSMPSLLLDHKVSISPLGDQIRVGGTMELGHWDKKINLHKIKGIVQAVHQYYPDLQVKMPESDSIWQGVRPCSPDGLPYIGPLAGSQNVFVAAGHGMLGISLGPATGKLVSEMISNQQTSIEISAFGPARFN